MDRLRARWLLALVLILAGLIVGVVGAFAYSLTEPKLYRAQTALIAQSGSQPVTGGVLQTIADLLTTDIVAQRVQFLGGRPGAGSEEPPESSGGSGSAGESPPPMDDEDIPF